MFDSLAVTPDSFGVVATFLRADPVVKGVMLGLAGASLWSWTVIIDRAFRLGGLNREADRFEGERAEFHRKVRDGFLAIAKAEPSRVVVIDADRPVAAVTADIRRAVDELLARR